MAVDARQVAEQAARVRAGWLQRLAPRESYQTSETFRAGLELILIEYAMRMGYLPSGPAPQDAPDPTTEALCQRDVSDPNEGPCRCLLPRGHEGLHQCRHTLQDALPAEGYDPFHGDRIPR